MSVRGATGVGVGGGGGGGGPPGAVAIRSTIRMRNVAWSTRKRLPAPSIVTPVGSLI